MRTVTVADKRLGLLKVPSAAPVVVVRVAKVKVVVERVVVERVVVEWVVVLSSVHKPGWPLCETAVVVVQLVIIPYQWIYFSYLPLLPDMLFPPLRSYP